MLKHSRMLQHGLSMLEMKEMMKLKLFWLEIKLIVKNKGSLIFSFL
jgi:hypothetical protein